MFVRSDRTPDLGDPVMMVMFGGSIVVYAALSLICMATTINARNRKNMNASSNSRGVPQGGRGDRNGDENDPDAGSSSSTGIIGLNPALAGVMIGFSMFLWQWAVQN